MPKTLLSAILTATLLAGCTSTEPNGVISVTTENNRKVTVTVINDNTIKIANTLPDEEEAQSCAVILEPQPFTGKINHEGDSTVITTKGGLTAVIKDKSGAVTIRDKGGFILSDDGNRQQNGDKQTIKLQTSGKGSLYGAGERGHSINLQGDTLVMYNRQNYGYTKGDERIKQMNITMPLVISSNGYALLMDDYAAAQMITGKTIEYTSESPKSVSYYVVDGDGTPAGTVENLTKLTGHQDLPPLWSLGYITSRYGYQNQQETLGAIDTLKREGYPVDAIVLDLYWYGKEEDMGRLSWDESWGDYKKMLAELKAEGVKTIAISQPYVLRNGRAIDNYNALAPKGLFVKDSLGKAPQEVKIWVGEGGMWDVSNPDTKAWLRARYKLLTDNGISGWWGDLGEPEVHPENAIHHNGLTARQYHNQYGNDWSRIIYDLFREEYPETRPMIMMRGGTTGLQRYSVFPWSTDVSRSWGGMQPQITIMLNSGLSGLGYMGHDVGGFAVDKANPTDSELYVRWLQLGLFSPVLRTHASYHAEPYYYPEYKDIINPLIKERYAWLPYNYTLAYENATKGYPLVRPLNFNSIRDNSLDEIDDEFLWGNDVLVAPVMEQGATSREITFPEGTWIDYNELTKVYEGHKRYSYKADIERLPIFVRAGAFLPRAEYAMANTEDYKTDKYTIKYFPKDGVTSSYTMYEDDCKSPTSISDKKYALITMDGKCLKRTITVKLTNEGNYDGAPKEKDIKLALQGINAQDIKQAYVGSKLVKVIDENGTATVSARWNVSKPLLITIITGK